MLGYWSGVETDENPFEDSPVIPGNPPVAVEVQPEAKRGPGSAPGSVANRFTPETARMMQAKWMAKREAMRQALQNPAPLPREAASVPSDEKMKSRVARIDERIDAILEKMEASSSSKDDQALAMALDRLCGVWSLLTGHPRPGVRKTDTKRGRPNFATPSE